MRVEERRIDIKKPPFNATLLKFSQYDNESLTLTCGNVHLTLSHKVHRPVSRCYCHDVYGYGLQAVVFSANPFDSNNTFHVRYYAILK